MKNMLRAAILLPTVLMIIFFASCTSTTKEDNNKPPDCEATCDTLGQTEVDRFEVLDQQLKYKVIKEWKRSKLYTLCIDATLLKKDERFEVAIYEPGRKKVEVLKFMFLPGKQQVFYIHRKSRFTPEISIKYYRNDSTEEYGVFEDTTTSACGVGLAVKDKLSSTSTEGSTVLVTIDEK